MDISEIAFYIGLYILAAIIISTICIYIFPQTEYLKSAPAGMTYTQYMFDRTYAKMSDICGYVQQVSSNLHRQIVEMSYPDVAKNVIYR